MAKTVINRRDFLTFMGRGALAASALGTLGTLSCSGSLLRKGRFPHGLDFSPLTASSKDDLLLAEGLSYKILLHFGDTFGSSNQLRFGANNDFTAFVPFSDSNPMDGMLWVNHEFPEPFLIDHSDVTSKAKSREQVLAEMDQVGGSLIRLHRDSRGEWKLDRKDRRNRRFTAQTPIPFASGVKIEGSNTAIGTLANCAGGSTPWGTVLSCEENYYQYYGEWSFGPNPNGAGRIRDPKVSYHVREDLGWGKQFSRPPTHYGWVVEIHPFTGEAKKLTALGRFNHEGATCVPLPDGRVVVYMGEDVVDRHLYKFISDRPGSLESGTLYAANIEKGEWLPLQLEAHPALKTIFGSQLNLLIEAPVAAAFLGATSLDRPEDIERDPLSGDMIIALTNNKPKGRPYGSLLRISEHNNDPAALRFISKTWISGGAESGIACPDNLVFDPNGDLWIASDMSAAEMETNALAPFLNNGLYYLPMRGGNAGKIFQVASAPVGAEFTGPSFLPDGTLLLSVQHPGDVIAEKMPTSRSSRWPDGSPRSAVVAIDIPWLKKKA